MNGENTKDIEPVEDLADLVADEDAAQPPPVPVEAEVSTEEGEAPGPKSGAEIDLDQAQQVISQLQEGNRNLYDQMLRARADFENFKRRTRREKEELVDVTKASVIKPLLEIADNFDRAMDAMEDPDSAFGMGIKMIHKQLLDYFAGQGVVATGAVGESFDPHIHEALAQQPTSDAPENTIVDVFQKGYMLRDRMLRPAQVRVSVKPEDDDISNDA